MMDLCECLNEIDYEVLTKENPPKNNKKKRFAPVIFLLLKENKKLYLKEQKPINL